MSFHIKLAQILTVFLMAIVFGAYMALELRGDPLPGVKMMQTAISDAKCSIRERCITLDCRYDWR
jgi:hypothetical protein